MERHAGGAALEVSFRPAGVIRPPQSAPLDRFRRDGRAGPAIASLGRVPAAATKLCFGRVRGRVGAAAPAFTPGQKGVMFRANGTNGPFLLRLRIAAALAALGALAGCASEEQPRLSDYLEEMSIEAPLEARASIDLGEFDVPLAVLPSASPTAEPVWMRLKFDLSAETTPKAQAAVLSALDRRRGAVSDAILTVIRSSSADDLADPRLVAIRSRMMEKVRPLLGDDRLRQLVLNDIDTEQL